MHFETRAGCEGGGGGDRGKQIASNLTEKIRAVAGQRSSPDLCFATKSIKIYDQRH